MTVNVQDSYTDLVADGILTIFPFEFGIVENVDLLVIVDGVLQIESSTYTLQNLSSAGGDVVFVEPPASGFRVLILRRTTISQNVDYGLFTSFPAETHEFNLDKITYILQELLSGAFGGLDSDGNLVVLTFDLSVTASETTVTINNSGGTGATLPAWESDTKAGVFHGEITTSAPANDDPTTKPDGFVWLEVAP